MTQNIVELEEVRPGVVQITMADRDTKNAFSESVIEGLIAGFAEAQAHQTCKAIVVTGYDSYFCSGGTKDMLTRLHEGKARFSDINLYDLPLECEVPVIAAMQGHAIGGGFVFGLFCDFVLLSRESVYTTNFMKYGFTPGMGATLIVPNKLGTALGHELLLSARNFRGGDLEKRGVPFSVLPRAEVVSKALELATLLAEMPRRSLVLLKSHLVKDLRQQLPVFIEKELEMHQLTFHDHDVRERINKLFNQ